MGLVFGYACHATTLSFDKWCADYPGYACESLEKSNPGAVCAFMAGCGADQNPLPRRTVALAKTYGKPVKSYASPVFGSLQIDGAKARISFKNAEGGLKSLDGKPLTWFTIAGADKKFVPAQAEISGGTVTVSSPEVKKPVAVRFGWDQIAEPNLANAAGLPASPFRTDDFPMVTAGKK